MKSFLRKLPLIVIALAVVGGLVFAFLPAPASVDLVTVERGPMELTVSEDGRTRIKERYLVSSPLGGRTMRSALKAGDFVDANRTVVCTIEPTDPALLDARTLTEAEMRVKASEALLKKAEAQRERADKARKHAHAEYARVEALSKRQVISDLELKDLEIKDTLAEQDYRTAQFMVQTAEYELKLVQSALVRTRPTSPGDNGQARFEIRAPITGRVLKVYQESATVVTPGQKLVEVGDPSDLEVEVDVLSSDAVKIPPRARVRFEHWGGAYPLEGRVRVVEPAAFMKQSALGVEEQRVWVMIDLVDPPERRATLGDAYRVVARIVVWEAADVLRVPSGCLHRLQNGDTAVYVVQNDTAVLRAVKIDHNNGIYAEVVAGLQVGDEVILHPSDKIHDGKAIKRR